MAPGRVSKGTATHLHGTSPLQALMHCDGHREHPLLHRIAFTTKLIDTKHMFHEYMYWAEPTTCQCRNVLNSGSKIEIFENYI